MKKILIMAGGSGGHIFPALSIAQKLQKSGYEIVWLGTKQRMEAEIIPQYNIPIHYISIYGIHNIKFSNLIKLPFKMAIALKDCYKIFKEVKPDLILSMGGFTSLPGGIVAKLLGIPLVVHEQNAIVGLTNKILSKISNLNITAYPNVINKALVLGQPLRESFNNLDTNLLLEKFQKNNEHLNILIVGGSQGAQILNNVVPAAIAQLEQAIANNTTHWRRIKVLHQSGKNKLDSTLANYQTTQVNKDNYDVVEFINNIQEQYLWADLVICRSGAITVFELASYALPAIYVPFEHKDKQQLLNAQYVSYNNLTQTKINNNESNENPNNSTRLNSIIIEQKDLTAEKLQQTISTLNKDTLKNMAINLREKATPKATQDISEQIINLLTIKQQKIQNSDQDKDKEQSQTQNTKNSEDTNKQLEEE